MRLSTVTRKPNVCGVRFRNPIIKDCNDFWIRVDSITDITNPTRNNGWILPNNSVYVLSHDGSKMVNISSGENGTWIAEIVNTDGLLDIDNGIVTTINVSDQINDVIDERTIELIKGLAPLDHTHEISDVNNLQNELDRRVDTDFVAKAISEHDGDPLAHPILRASIDFVNGRIDNIVGMGKFLGTFDAFEDLPENINLFEPIVPSTNDWAVTGREDGFYYAYIISTIDQENGYIEWLYGWRMSADPTLNRDELYQSLEAGDNIVLERDVETGAIIIASIPPTIGTIAHGRFFDQPAAQGGVRGSRWRLYEGGTLVVDSGYINWTVYPSPWDEWRNLILRIVFRGPITGGPGLRSLFRFMNNVETIEGLTFFDTSQTTTMENMFRNAHALRELDLRSFDMSNVTNTERMFLNTRVLKNLRLGNLFRFVTHNSGVFRRAPDSEYTGFWANRNLVWTEDGWQWQGFVLTARQFMDEFNGATMAGGWEWQRWVDTEWFDVETSDQSQLVFEPLLPRVKRNGDFVHLQGRFSEVAVPDGGLSIATDTTHVRFTIPLAYRPNVHVSAIGRVEHSTDVFNVEIAPNGEVIMNRFRNAQGNSTTPVTGSILNMSITYIAGEVSRDDLGIEDDEE